MPIVPALRARLVVFCLSAMLSFLSIGSLPMAQANERLCFPEAAPVIRDCVEGRFAQFWREHGGLPVFGYPITPAKLEFNQDLGKEVLTQYFERQRFELHPQNQRPYDVLLGRLGAVWLERQGENFNRGDKGSPALPNYVTQTGYNIGFKPNVQEPEGLWYWDYYAGHGLEFDGRAGNSYTESLALIGFPLTAVRANMTTETSFQVFERTIIRYQGPKYNNSPEWRMVADRIGVWYYKHVMNADSENRLSYP